MKDGAEVAGDERRVVEHRLQERDVRRDAADAELGEAAPGAATAAGKSRPRQVIFASIESKCGLICAPG